MKKTLLLCFIHGFKVRNITWQYMIARVEGRHELTRLQGGEDTFATFPSHLKAILQHALPKITVLVITYPKFETRGDLHECVARFKEW